MQTLIDWSYFGLFIATFLAGSILPFSSEMVLSGVLAMGADDWGCLAAATLGNTLGGMTCYWIGHAGKTEWMEKYLKIRPEKLQRNLHFMRGKGALMGFFTFVPLVGDVMAVTLGYMRANPWLTFSSMLAGKLLRYYVWMHLTYSMLKWAF
jgi:membrane protein YqaA with SNARE-associated domain